MGDQVWGHLLAVTPTMAVGMELLRATMVLLLKAITVPLLKEAVMVEVVMVLLLKAIMDCCHSGTGLDLPYVHNLPSFSGQAQKKKKKKIKKKKSKKVKKQGELPGTSAADVMLYSGCRDDQTSADTSVGGEATGAMTWAFTSAFKKNPNLTYFGVLEAMRDVLNGSGRYTQVPQLSTGRPINLNQPFTL